MPRALVEGQLAQRRPADVAGVVEHRAEIEPARAGRRDEAAVDRRGDVGELALAGDPLALGVIEQLRGLHLVSPCGGRAVFTEAERPGASHSPAAVEPLRFGAMIKRL